jgi:hypothetical protein
MHWHYNPWFSAFLKRQEFQPVCLLRHPLDVLISILRFAPREPATARWLEGECGDERTLSGATPISCEFADYCLSPRAATLLNVSPGWAHASRAVMRYEDLVQNTRPQLERFLAALGLSPRAPIENVVANEAIDNLRPLAPHHFWQGRSGLWQDLFSADLAQAAYRHLDSAFESGSYASVHSERPAPLTEEIAAAWKRLTGD